MKLLIADDELLTREGLKNGINWESLGIDTVILASDGWEALECVRSYQPDIILTDVRMPRMDGIRLAKEAQILYPDTVIIFMSGYSDKEYLMAAIRLQAVSYVEKPLSLSDVQDAIKEAVSRRKSALHTKQQERLLSAESSGRLTVLFTRPFKDHPDEIRSALEQLDLPQRPVVCLSYIWQLKTGAFDESGLDGLFSKVEKELSNCHGYALHMRQQPSTVVLHLLFKKEPGRTRHRAIDEMMLSGLRSLGTCAICRGMTVPSVERLYESYMSAVILLQTAYFYPAGSLLTYESEERERRLIRKSFGTEAHRRFYDALITEDKRACSQELDRIYSYFQKAEGVLPNVAKDAYYRFFSAIWDARGYFRLAYEGGATLAFIEECFNLDEMQAGLSAATEDFFAQLRESAGEDETIYRVKEYISANYQNEGLSIRDMAEHVYLSASYLSTYFKNLTGQTLNQYLTGYRMKKAMHLLADPRIPVNDISAKVGYSNGNYFGKSFKKYTGLSPSGYREKLAPQEQED